MRNESPTISELKLLFDCPDVTFLQVESRSSCFKVTRHNENLFVKAISNFPFNTAYRQLEGELLAKELNLPTLTGNTAVTILEVLPSKNWDGDFYLVSPFISDGKSPTKYGSIGDDYLNSTGRICGELQKITPTPNTRQATDQALNFANTHRNSTNNDQSQGVAEFMSLVRDDLPTMSSRLKGISRKSPKSSFAHGDLKINQFITSDSTLKLADWEECGTASSMTDLGTLCSDVFYGLISEKVDKILDDASSSISVEECYRSCAEEASESILAIKAGFQDGANKTLSADEVYELNCRLGLGGFVRSMNLASKTNYLPPRQLALASLAYSIGTGAFTVVK